MSKNYKQKLKKINFIFLIIGVLAVAAAISYDRIKPKIWYIDYRLVINNLSENNLKSIDNKLILLTIKDNTAEAAFTAYINSIIGNSPSKIDVELLGRLNSLVVAPHVIKFSAANKEGLDSQINKLLIEVNKIVRDAIDKRMSLYLNIIMEKDLHFEKNEAETLKKNIETILNIRSNSAIYDKDAILKPMVFSILSKELQLSNITANNLNATGLIDKDMFASTDSLISVLNLIYERKIAELNNFSETYSKKNYDYQRLLNKRDQLINTDYLRIVKKNEMNKKPSKLFLIASFLFVGFLLSIVIIFFYLSLPALGKKTKKMLTTLLSRE